MPSDNTSSFDWQTFSDNLNANHVPEIMLILVGVIALLIVYSYLKDNDSPRYKLMVLLGICDHIMHTLSMFGLHFFLKHTLIIS